MDYIVGRIPGNMRIDPDAGGQERQRKREKPAQKSDSADSVSISDEAKRRISLDEVPDCGDAPES